MICAAAFSIILFALRAAATYYPLIEYSGTTFFDGFDFYGAIDNTTWGNVTYADAADATAESLAYVNPAGNAILRVDNSSTVLATGIQYRKSVRLTSKAQFDIGTLFVIDALHMPYGCSVWPSIWLNGVLEPGQVWPAAGEIDLIEAINLMDHNQMALHSYAGCVQPANVTQLGQSVIHNCNDTTASGCTVEETKNNSFGAGFAQANGGAFGLQFDTAGVFMWFWSRPDIPASITQASPTTNMVITDWGVPSAAYPASGCNISQFFPAQELVVDITLCGLWAGIPSVYAQGCPGDCFASNIAGNGSNYANAYFEIPSIRTYTVDPAVAAAASASSTPQTTGPASGAPSAQATGGGSAAAADTGGAAACGVGALGVLSGALVALGLGLL
ncbi:concanavalin A-like lectin/glucanase domain-containing protein [Mycena pura]|uniref:Concanavalin A-like lectin/glucanase domain-containing protein n=1 Tax=Mycena pura TaxID=153505 RepID=A0AAD6ULN3_9AGAR|nr:concanavalin A-like lectin/glucanase domain-containing protein [Mycena pura]